MSATNSSTQSTLSPFPPGSRYEVRHLTTPTHALWAAAIGTQGMLYQNPIFAGKYDHPAVKFDLWVSKLAPMNETRMSPNWTLSLGVFDLEYQYSTEEARRAEGKFHWNDWPDEETKRRELESMSLADLEKRMDFPLVAYVLSSDGFYQGDKEMAEEFMGTVPETGAVHAEYERQDPRDEESRKPPAAGQLLERRGTSTRPSYEGKGIAKKLTYYLLGEARRQGFQTMVLDSMNLALTHILLNVPSPYSARVIAQFGLDDVKDADGQVVFKKAKPTVLSRIIVDLNATTSVLG